MTMESNVVEFSSFAAARATTKARPESAAARYCNERKAAREVRLHEAITFPENLTTSCRNSRLRLSRRDAWWTADRLTGFARARFEWLSKLKAAQSWNVPGADHYPSADEEDGRFDLVAIWRDALVQQMLTPAPDMRAIDWKRAQFRSGEHRFTNVKPEQLQQAIAADVEWLKNHPTKKSIPMSHEKKQERSRFKEAMRQRIREIATSRALSDDDIRPALSLRHRHIAKFTETHGVNLEWLIEGQGRIFKKGQ